MESSGVLLLKATEIEIQSEDSVSGDPFPEQNKETPDAACCLC